MSRRKYAYEGLASALQRAVEAVEAGGSVRVFLQEARLLASVDNLAIIVRDDTLEDIDESQQLVCISVILLNVV